MLVLSKVSATTLFVTYKLFSTVRSLCAVIAGITVIPLESFVSTVDPVKS